MTARGHRIASLHGAKDPAERDAIIDNFRDGRGKGIMPFFPIVGTVAHTLISKVLITTNVIARGSTSSTSTWWSTTTCRLCTSETRGGGGQGGNLDKPDIETYIHRIGVYSFFASQSQNAQLMHAGERAVSDAAVSRSIMCTTRTLGCRWSRSRRRRDRRSENRD